MKIDMDGGIDWPSIIQAITAVIALSLGLFAVVRDRGAHRAAQTDALRLFLDSHDLASRVVGKCSLASTNEGIIEAEAAKALLYDGDLRELLSTLAGAGVGNMLSRAARKGFMELRVLARDIEGRLRLCSEGGGFQVPEYTPLAVCAYQERRVGFW